MNNDDTEDEEYCINCGAIITDSNRLRSCATCDDTMCDNCWFGTGDMCEMCEKDSMTLGGFLALRNGLHTIHPKW